MKFDPENIQLMLAKLSEMNVHVWLYEGEVYINAPVGVLTETLKDSLRQNRERLLSYLKKAEARREVISWPQIVPDAMRRNEPFPLSEMQLPFWNTYGGDKDNGLVGVNYYHEMSCENLDLSRLSWAFRQLFERHDMMRAVVGTDGVQRTVARADKADIQVRDLRACSGDEQEEILAEIRETMLREKFPAELCPLFAIRAIRLSEDITHLCFSWSFINLDVWSLNTIFREWKVLYYAPNVQLPAMNISYRDYVLAKRQLRNSNTYKRDRDYWLKRLDDIPNGPTLPVHTIADLELQPAFSRRSYRMAKEKWRTLKERGKDLGITPSGLLLAAFCEVVSYWSEQMHFSLSHAQENRLPLHADVNSLVGNFTSKLLLEVDLRKTNSFKERAVALQQQVFRDQEHRLVSADEVLRERARRKGSASLSPLAVSFSSTLTRNTEGGDSTGLLDSFGQGEYGVSITPGVWLDSQVMEDNGDLLIHWDAFEERFLPGVLDAMFNCNGRFMDRIGRSQEIWEQPEPLRLTSEEVVQGPQENTISVELPGELLHEGVIRRAMRNPEAVAVITSKQQMGYGELLLRSSVLAEQLSERGLRTGEVVAVVIPKGWEQVVAVLGTLIAGGAYMPIDPELPGTQRRQLFEQSGARFAVVTEGAAEALDIPLRIQRVEVVQRSPVGSMPLPVTRQRPEDIAYVIFASDSKGVPKGRMINHRSAVNTLGHVNGLFQVNNRDRALAVSSWSFDLSVYDIFGLLAVGGAIVIPDDGRSTDPEHWHDLIRKHNVTLWYSSPPLANMLANYMEGFAQPPDESIRLMLLSGNWIPPELSTKSGMLFPQAELVSLGGIPLQPVSGPSYNQ